MLRKLYIAIFALLLLLALALVFFYPLGRMLGGLLARGSEGAAIAAYPDELKAQAARRGGYAAYGDIPACLTNGIISVEDKRFFAHAGIDAMAAVRVFFEDFRNDHQDHGGSTISQQLARSILKISRHQPSLLALAGSELRVAEGALILEHDFSKQEILELYLNGVYFGRGATGAPAAARAYFGKPLGELDPAQCIYLAGLPQAPTVFGQDPGGDYAESRFAHVVGTMYRNGYLTADEAEDLKAQRLFAPAPPAS